MKQNKQQMDPILQDMEKIKKGLDDDATVAHNGRIKY
jgi:hypothetical protein